LAGRVTSAFALLRRDKPCAPQPLCEHAAGSHRRAAAALWRAAKAEGLPAPPKIVPVFIGKQYHFVACTLPVISRAFWMPHFPMNSR
jgi:hypothetical protein